jgi:hypothetical protein
LGGVLSAPRSAASKRACASPSSYCVLGDFDFMKPDDLFLARCKQLAMLVESKEEIDVLDLSHKLRTLLMDKASLAQTVNKSKLKLEFKVGAIQEIDPAPFSSVLLIDAIDPELAPKNPALVLDLEDFLKHPIGIEQGTPITIKQIIRYAAHIAGGIHHDPVPAEEYALLDAYAKGLVMFGYSGTTYLLKGIARVALRGLQPLISDIENRNSRA